ncbi:hypothetical protein H0H92_005726, partial [Tricholoma furcatifolium]
FPYSYRPNLQVLLYSTVTQIEWVSIPRVTSGQAIANGVQYVDSDGTTHTASANTVILSAGTWGSPPILERSGIGNATYLSSLGIQSVVDLPGVGENLSEQTLLPMQWQLNASLACPGDPFLLNTPEGLSDALWDMHKALFAQGAPWVEGYIVISTPADGPSILTWYPVNLHPLSRGSVHIVSSNGTEYPEIQYNFFQNPFDLYVMAASAQRVQQIVSTPPLSDYIAAPITPAAGVTSLEDLSYVQAEASYTNHIMGTALMAPQEIGGVVDSNLKVYGTQNVYVVDASVIPLEPAAHLQATVYAVAERAAELFTQ